MTASGAGPLGGAPLILILRLAAADCDAGWVESVTFTVADQVPTEACTGVPVIIPVALFIERPLGRLPAL